MKQSFRSNISATTIQLLLNQVFSLLVFYFLSKSLSKADFGELNWTLAIFMTVFAILSFGLDQVMIKKIASGENKSDTLTLYFFHVLISGIFFYGLLILLYFIFPGFFEKHSLLLLLGAGKLLLFFSNPFKTIAGGQEHFRAVLYMSVSSTIIKGSCVCFLFYSNNISLATIVPVFIIADCSELFIGFFLSAKILKTPLLFKFHKKPYLELIKSAFPQIGTVIFSSALARIDWILIGFFLSASKLAEYSFAYKAFELSSLPLLAIAPLLVPYFTRLLKEDKSLDQQDNVHLLLRAEMMIACLAALCLNIGWNPFIDSITAGKYGAVNTTTVFFLSASLPVLYLNNFLWSIHFAYGNLKLIFYSFIICLSVNVFGNVFLIPIYQNDAAAFVYLISIAAQTIYYSFRLRDKIRLGWQPLLFCSASALCSGAVSKYSSLSIWWILPCSIIVYIFLLLFTIQLRKSDWPVFKRVMNR